MSLKNYIMLHSLQNFAREFEPYQGEYVVIGGAACHLWLAEEQTHFRNTRDVDMVLLLQSRSADPLAAMQMPLPWKVAARAGELKRKPDWVWGDYLSADSGQPTVWWAITRSSPCRPSSLVRPSASMRPRMTVAMPLEAAYRYTFW